MSDDTTPGLVTIGLPIYKRLEWLPHVLGIIEAQDYPDIDLLVSDNGQIGEELRDLVDAHYDRPYRLVRREKTHQVTEHFNVIVADAAGEYFMLLCDDDELSPNYVSALVDLLERHPDAPEAMARQEKIDLQGNVLLESVADLPETVPADEFLRLRADYWETGVRNTVTFVARTAELRRVGGWPVFARGIGSDEALHMKMSLGRDIAFARDAVFRHRAYPESLGVSSGVWQLVEANRQFLAFIDADPDLRRFARAHPERWRRFRDDWVWMIWRQYYRVWSSRYRDALPFREWARAAFTLPPYPGYYARVAATLARHAPRAAVRKLAPRAYRLYQRIRYAEEGSR